ncbi:hypothetical protein [Saccharophagus degradans]|uniref:Uncharacterized protein n=1 Tax=Saccharophagus degradans (strain 2-40 / ATCC 43961 / DSM 17024) TaxID=203122 RepID=Q21L42_SACD2|nr:hypothetical protein [Saccharophagus degradans]ABD80587.1 hypothetical protein Sde_1325 [Saccharophagus degradans 2-40]WGO97219.1 hypothetical protein QFX18_14340 [Saccharophagus degradans]
MKIKMEIDISPQEVLELFEGNVESLQKAMLGTIAHSYDQAVKNNDFQPQQIFDFWQGMAEKSQAMFTEYSQAAAKKSDDK